MPTWRFWQTKDKEEEKQKKDKSDNEEDDEDEEEEDEEEGDDDFYKSPPCPKGATNDALRRRALMNQKKNLRKEQTSYTYQQMYKKWRVWCKAPAGTIVDGVTMPSDKEVMDTTVTVAKAEAYIVDYVAKRNKCSGGPGLLSSDTIEKTLCGVMDIMRFQIADDYEEKYSRAASIPGRALPCSGRTT